MSITSDLRNNSRHLSEQLLREATRLSQSPEYPVYTDTPPSPHLGLLVAFGIVAYDGTTISAGQRHVTPSSQLVTALVAGAIDERPELADQIRSVAFRSE